MSAWQAFVLSCGHWTTPEVQLFHKVWKPKGRRYFCEQCEEWLARQPKPKPVEIPDEPMF